MPVETKQKLAAAGNALDAELTTLRGVDADPVTQGLGQSAETAAGKIRYQMNRLRTLAANFQLQKEASLSRHAEAIVQALHPQRNFAGARPWRRLYFARHGFRTGRNSKHPGRKPLPGTYGAVAVRDRDQRSGISARSRLFDPASIILPKAAEVFDEIVSCHPGCRLFAGSTAYAQTSSDCATRRQ